VSFKGVSSASSKQLSKTLSETGSNPAEPQHFAVFVTILYGWLWRVHSSKQARKRAKYSRSPAMEQTTLWQWLCWSRLGPPFRAFKHASYLLLA